VPLSATTVYTDGACSGNPGPGGWAWAVPGARFRSGAAARTTNQRMELQAVLDAVGSLDGPLDVVSDSTYVVNCFRDRWWKGWLKRGWVNSQRKPVANRDLWEPLVAAYQADPGRLSFRWVKGHGSDPMNDLVDRLAVEAGTTQQGREGSGPPGDLGPPDRPGAGRLRAPAPGVGGQGREAPEGHLVAVTGLRPQGLGGFGETSKAASVRHRLAEILEAKQQLDADLVVLSGLGLGAETLGAEAAAAVKVPYVAVLAYPDADRMWPAESRRHFAELLAGAAEVITLDRRAPDTKQKAGAAMARRDGWLAAHAEEALVVWDEEDPFVGRTLRSFQDRLGEEQVWVVQP
jgi:ribonuclease HI/uncharacterized phage-like protein YoqJ